MSRRFLKVHLMTLLVAGLLAGLFLGSDRSLGPVWMMALTWFTACVAVEALWHRSLDEITILTMAPAAHLAAVAALPAAYGVVVVPAAAVAGSLIFRRWGFRKALLYGAVGAIPVLGALELLVLSGAHAPLAAPGAGLELLHVRQLLWLLAAGALQMVLSQGIRALVAGRIRRVSPLRAWRDAFGTQTEIVTAGALVTVGVLALFCYELLGYRGILLCVMPLLFVRDGSRRYLELEAAQAKLIQNERLAAKGEMAAEIGHELNNYLAAVSGRAQLLLRNLNGDAGSALGAEAERVRVMSTEMAELAKGLMDFSHREARRAAFGLNELVEKTMDFVRPQTRFRGIVFGFEPDPDLPAVEMDPGQIQQVLLTLFGRAVAPGGGAAACELRIRTFADERRRTVGVEIRSPRGEHPAGSAADGDEAALGTVQRILDRHHGRFESRTESPEDGETYRIVLPAA